MSLDTLVQIFDFENAREFLHALMPTSEVWHGVQLNQNIFRGQANAEWKLIPVALRSPEASNGQQRLTELRSLTDFWREADRQGLSVSGDRHEVRDLWISPVAPAVIGRELLLAAGRNDFAAKIRPWPPTELWQGLALAQHHGVPTRLLDWSRLPMVAAYFAALGAAARLESGTAAVRLAIWACHENVLLVAPWLDPPEQYVHLVAVPRAGNPNLHAQHGVFTLMTPGGTSEELPDKESVACPSLDEVLERVMAVCRSGPGNLFTFMVVEAGPPLRKLTLPVTEAPQLLEYLDMLGISAATLVPGFGGAARGANERAMRKRLLDDKSE